MSATQILTELAALGIRVEVAGDKLRLRPKEAVTPDLMQALLRHKAELLRLLAQSHHETARVPARVRGQDAVIETASAETCFHCTGARVCKCICCAIPGKVPMTWEPGQCQSCKGTGCLTDAQPKQQAGKTASHDETCGGCYRVSQRRDGTPIRLHPPKVSPAWRAWLERWQPKDERLQ